MRPKDADYEKRWAEKLAQEARILGEARMLRDEQPITDELCQAVITRFRDLIARQEKTDSWAARSIGISAATLSQVLSGSYGGDNEKHIRQIDKWTEQQILRETAPKPAGFVKTKVAGQIYGVTKWIQEINGIAVVHGPAGIGKTITVNAIRAETPGSVYARISTTGQSKLSVMELLAGAARVTGARFTANALYHALVEALKGTNRLIIVDEVHKLAGRMKDEALHCLRDLHDDTECPMVWVGMSNIADYIQMGKTKFEPLDQIFSRVKYWLNLRDVANQSDGGPGLYTVEDIRKWINAQKIRVTEDAIRYLQMLANTPGMGGLRTCDGLIRIAVRLATRLGDKPIDAQILRDIRGEQLGARAAEQFEREMERRVARSA